MTLPPSSHSRIADHATSPEKRIAGNKPSFVYSGVNTAGSGSPAIMGSFRRTSWRKRRPVALRLWLLPGLPLSQRELCAFADRRQFRVLPSETNRSALASAATDWHFAHGLPGTSKSLSCSPRLRTRVRSLLSYCLELRARLPLRPACRIAQIFDDDSEKLDGLGSTTQVPAGTPRVAGLVITAADVIGDPLIARFARYSRRRSDLRSDVAR